MSAETLMWKNIGEALLRVISQTPEGAAGERLYEPLKAYLAREDFERLMRTYVLSGWVKRRGKRYFPGIWQPR